MDKELIKNQRAIATVHHAFASSLKKRLDAAMAAAQRQVHEHCRATKSAPCVCTSYLFVALTLDSDGRIIGVMPLTTTGDGAIDGILIDAAQKAGSVGVVPASLLDDTGRTRLPFGFELELQ